MEKRHSLARELDWLMIERGKPKMIVSDNGSELTSNAILTWVDGPRRMHYIAPGKPMQNASSRALTAGYGTIVERNAVHLLAQARCPWMRRADDNGSRPHSQVGWKTASEFAFTLHPRRDLALRYALGFAPAPVAPSAQQGKWRTQTWIKLGGRSRPYGKELIEFSPVRSALIPSLTD